MPPFNYMTVRVAIPFVLIITCGVFVSLQTHTSASVITILEAGCETKRGCANCILEAMIVKCYGYRCAASNTKFKACEYRKGESGCNSKDAKQLITCTGCDRYELGTISPKNECLGGPCDGQPIAVNATYTWYYTCY